MSDNQIFVLPASEYSRDINVLKHYVDDTSFFLSTSTGKDIGECKAFVLKGLSQSGKFKFIDPQVNYLSRKDNGDREKLTIGLNAYLMDSVAKNELIAPTLTTYLPPTAKTSILAQYININKKKRNAAKKEMFVAEAKGQTEVFVFKSSEQKNRKLANNAISGSHVSASTPLYNKTAHSTLTSTCRVTAGYGNANNEKFLSGNRHYYSYQITLANLVSVANGADVDALTAVIERYKLHLPTVEETMTCVKRSTVFYWFYEDDLLLIYKFISGLTPIQRAAIVYTGDMFQLKEYNPAFVRGLLKELSAKVTCSLSRDECALALKKAPEDQVTLAHQICRKEMQGNGHDYLKLTDLADFQNVAGTALNIEKTLLNYRDLIRALWVTDNIPASVAYIPEIIRRCAVTSDTDSTIFTVQDWVQWYNSAIVFNDETRAISASMVFLASATITHVLAIVSANFGIEKGMIYDVAMINEFAFEVFVPTQLGKHYFASIGCKEGNIRASNQMEIKGVYLKSSNVPAEITATAKAMMEGIMNTVMLGEKVSVIEYLRKVADTERSIVASIRKGESTYLRKSSIKDSASYTAGEDQSPYAQYILYNEVFGPKYGIVAAPPYATLKISIDANSPTELKKWITNIQDKELAFRLQAYVERTGKTGIGTLNFPASVLQANGMPQEISDVIAYRKIVSDIVKIFYIILETTGIYMSEKKVMRLASDYY